jgi:predicted nucleotidyltransferase
MEMDQVYLVLSSWPDESIYEGNGLAMPDEVVNFRRGEGIEKAITFINIAKSRHLEIAAEQRDKKIIVKIDHQKFEFPVTKNLVVPNGIV